VAAGSSGGVTLVEAAPTSIPPRYGSSVDQTLQVPSTSPVDDRERNGGSDVSARGLRAAFRPRATLPATVEVEPKAVYLGEVRKGDQRTAKVHVKMLNGSGNPEGCVASGPAWATVTPMRFGRRRQVLTVTANSEQVWQTGEFEDVLRLDTGAG